MRISEGNLLRPGHRGMCMGSLSRAQSALSRMACRAALTELPVVQQLAGSHLPGASEGPAAFNRSGTATLFLPPQLMQTVRTVRVRREPLTLQDLAAPREFQEVQSELLSRLTSDSSTTSATVLGVDPDCSGAIAILRVSPTGNSALDMLKEADVSIYDMPTEKVPTAKRFRKQADPCKVSSIVSTMRDKLEEGESIQAVVEKPIPGPQNGIFSIYGTGFAYGVWAGILAAHRIEIDTVAARRWKSDLGLNGLGKEGSLAMALQLFPQAQHLLGRKKDHGRAEALLILAWAVGVRAAPPALQKLSADQKDKMDQPLTESFQCE